MKSAVRLIINGVICILLILPLSCSYQRLIRIPDATGFPEEIYISPANMTTPPIQFASQFKVGVFRFTNPPNTSVDPTVQLDLGTMAAQYLCEELTRNRLFSKIYMEDIRGEWSDRDVLMIGKQKGYDLIIIGSVTYYIEGSRTQPASVDEVVRVMYIKNNKHIPLWHARASTVVNPARNMDFFIIEAKGAPAPSGMTLLKANAKKMSNMIRSDLSSISQ